MSERNEAILRKAIDALAATLRLVKSMRTVDVLSPAEHGFEIDKRREAWGKVDAEIDAVLGLLSPDPRKDTP